MHRYTYVEIELEAKRDEGSGEGRMTTRDTRAGNLGFLRSRYTTI
jgi:hypothetical protein